MVGSKDLIWVQFISLPKSSEPGIRISFGEPVKYGIGHCILNAPFTMPDSSVDKVWTFIKQDSSLQLLCNGEEIFDLNYKEHSDSCKMNWLPDMARVRFSSSDTASDTASDLFRQFRNGKTFRIILLYFRISLSFNI